MFVRNIGGSVVAGVVRQVSPSAGRARRNSAVVTDCNAAFKSRARRDLIDHRLADQRPSPCQLHCSVHLSTSCLFSQRVASAIFTALAPLRSQVACSFASISPKLHVQSPPNFLWTPSMAVARSSFGGVAICYALPVYG